MCVFAAAFKDLATGIKMSSVINNLILIILINYYIIYYYLLFNINNIINLFNNLIRPQKKYQVIGKD